MAMTIAGYLCGVIVAVAMIVMLIWYMKPPKDTDTFVRYIGDADQESAGNNSRPENSMRKDGGR